MATEACCQTGMKIFSDWVIPEGIVQRKLGDFYENHPIMSRLLVAPVALFTGFMKVFFFPLICLVGVVAMPIIALVRSCRGNNDGGGWLQAWCFCILGVAATAAFLGVACYYLPLINSATILVIMLAISIVLHVGTLLKEPKEPLSFQEFQSLSNN